MYTDAYGCVRATSERPSSNARDGAGDRPREDAPGSAGENGDDRTRVGRRVDGERREDGGRNGLVFKLKDFSIDRSIDRTNERSIDDADDADDGVSTGAGNAIRADGDRAHRTRG